MQELNKLQELSHKVTLNRLKGYSQHEFTSAKTSENKFQCTYKSLVLILVVSPSFYQSLKLFFNPDTCSLLLNKLFPKKKLSEMDQEKLCIDLFKEVANLSAGFIKKKLEDAGHSSDISLPICLRGYDDLFSHQGSYISSATDSWIFSSGSTQIMFSATTHQMTPDFKANIDPNLPIDNGNGDIDFF
jgi:CheY-specific phosphatase CheX